MRLKLNITLAVERASDEPRGKNRPSPPMNIILTGSTGSLGSYILDVLLAHPNVERIVCFNRSDDAPSRQTKSNASKGLATDFPSSRVEFVHGDLEAPFLGLGEQKHGQLLDTTTHILHNAWPVDFNRHVQSFEPQIRGVRQLIDFAHASRRDAAIFFISSVSTIANWGRISSGHVKVPEIPIADWRSARMGYGKSKLIVEKLLEDAAKVSGVRTAICRVGQVGGPVDHGVQGHWNKQEWLPALIASSKYLGKIPSTLGPIDNVDWIPVDQLASIIVELLEAIPAAHGRLLMAKQDGVLEEKKLSKAKKRDAKQPERTVAVYHAVNPQQTSWSTLIPSIAAHFTASKDSQQLQTVDLPTWVELLRASIVSHPLDVDLNPATKLLESYFDNLEDKTRRFPKTLAAPFDTNQTAKESATLRQLEPVNPAWMSLWMRQWQFGAEY